MGNTLKKALLLAFLGSAFSAHAALSLEADASAFFPTNSNMRQIYGDVWPDFGIAIDHIQPFPCLVPSLMIFGQVNYLYSSGHSKGGDQSTHIRLVPITLGLKWVKQVDDRMELALGAGPKYYFLHIHNNSSFVPHSQNENGCGGYAVANAFFYPTCHFMIDLFLSYSYMKFSAPSSTADNVVGLSTNVSGIDLGAGIGWKF